MVVIFCVITSDCIAKSKCSQYKTNKERQYLSFNIKSLNIDSSIIVLLINK